MAFWILFYFREKVGEIQILGRCLRLSGGPAQFLDIIILNVVGVDGRATSGMSLLQLNSMLNNG